LAGSQPTVHVPGTALPASAWARIAASPTRLLILDYDGTLVPLHAERMAARIDASLLTLLRDIAARSRLRPIVLSGRPIVELVELMGAAGIRLIGEHGWNEWSPERGVLEHPLDPHVEEALREGATTVEDLLWGHLLEIKRSGVVFHTRGLLPSVARDYEQRVASLWRPLGSRPGLRFDRTIGGLELRSSARDKGTVVAELLDDSPPGTLITFLGDDVTDEAAFTYLRGLGVTIRVGEMPRPSEATYHLATPSQVEAFLRRWLALLPEPGARA
jgi:trehalose-phosphatase